MPCAAFRAWLHAWSWAKAAGDALTGLRTLLFFSVTGAIGLADALNGIDISGLLSSWLGAQVKVGDIITLMSVAGVLLRLVTRTSMFARWRRAATGTTASSVDDPEAK